MSGSQGAAAAPPHLGEQGLVAQQLALGDVQVVQEAGKGGICTGGAVL